MNISSNTINSNQRGSLNVWVGPMFAGKTTLLNAELTRLADTGFKVLKIVHSDDKRMDLQGSDDSGSTHNSSYNTLSKRIDVTRSSTLAMCHVADYHVIGIDEGQFFPDLYQYVQEWTDILGKHVRVSGLDGNSNRTRFGQMHDLLPISDQFVKVTALCHDCLEEVKKNNSFHGNIHTLAAPFTKRLVADTEEKLIGGADMFKAVCRYHYNGN